MRQDKGQEKIEKSADVKDGYNVGLSLLRAFMCFSVILCHFWGNFDTGWRGWLSFFKGYAVPVFMLMSFFLTEKTLMSYDKKKIRKRLERLLIPFVLWPLVYWLVYNIVDLCKSGYGLGCSITDLLWQLFMGHSPKLNVLMWYQFDLIILSLLLAAIIYVFRKNYIHILCACMMAAWLLQYSGWNKLFFGGLRFEMTYPLGRLAEMFPYAACGFLMAHFGICKKLEKYQGGGIYNCSFVYLHS